MANAIQEHVVDYIGNKVNVNLKAVNHLEDIITNNNEMHSNFQHIQSVAPTSQAS